VDVKGRGSSLASLGPSLSGKQFLVGPPASPVSSVSRHLSSSEEADIVCCTLSGCGSPQLLECVMNTSSSSTEPASSSSASLSSNRQQSIVFDAVIIDEAAQAVEPSTIIPFKYHPKVHLVASSISR
jgi:hypothetical protein